MRGQFRNPNVGRGFTIMAFLAVVVAGVLAYLATMLGPDAMEAYRKRKTEVALAQARDALLGYALRYRDIELAQDLTTRAMYGYLPLPDLGTTRNINIGCGAEGCDAGNFSGNSENRTVIGRLPWRTLGTEPLRDGHGECLWYAVSGSHKRTQPAAPMNWDSLGQLDVVVATGDISLKSLVDDLGASPHERPVAIIFSAGPALPNQNRGRIGADSVNECGGNYNVANYLDPDVVGALAGVQNFFGGSTNNATGDTAITPKKIASQGEIHRADDGKFWANGCPPGGNCTLSANDRGLSLASGILFDSIRKNANFRVDINSLLDRIVGCLRDDLAAGTVITGVNKIQGADDNTCYGEGVVPRGYYPNYRDMIFVAGNAPLVNGESCAGALLFANQRGPGESRATPAERTNVSNYLEGINVLGTGPYSGQERLDRVSILQSAAQDIVRCLPTTPNFVTTQSSQIDPLTGYTPATHTLTLGATVSSPIDSDLANYLFQCAWTPEARAMNAGLRTYFTFRINDSGFTTNPHEGFTFTIVDGDNNGTNICGAAAQHLGYSGNNTETAFIVPPKIAFEVDLRREDEFDPAATDHLLNGRNDPSTDGAHYRGGHVALVYWGGETPVNTTHSPPPNCIRPAYNSGGVCYLPQEEDDNVHGQPANTRTGFAPPPANPPAPPLPLSVPPDTPAGLYKLDPDRTSIPVNQDFHVRVELTRAATNDFSLPQVRAATTTSVDLANPVNLIDASGAYQLVIDGIYLFDGDRVLVKDQFDATQNGVYVWHAGSPPAVSRATDADTAVELAGLSVEVLQGATNAHSIWRQSDSNPVVGTSALRWTNIRVKVAAPSSTNTTSPGLVLDGIRMAPGDRVFVMSHGVYVWHGAATPMTPATDVVSGATIQVQQGSQAPSWWQYDGSSWRRLVVRTSTQAALDLSNPGATIGGIALAGGDRVLVRHQATSADNGIYVWNGAAVAMTRATDANTATKLAGALTQVQEGTDAGRSFRQTALAATGALGTNAVQWEAIDRSPAYLLEAWILPDSGTYANMIAAMQDTTRPMSTLYPAFTPHLRDRPVIPYPFRNVRLGFTTGQRTTTTDQTITIRNIFSSWLQ